jgi:hypothetical protein
MEEPIPRDWTPRWDDLRGILNSRVRPLSFLQRVNCRTKKSIDFLYDHDDVFKATIIQKGLTRQQYLLIYQGLHDVTFIIEIFLS